MVQNSEVRKLYIFYRNHSYLVYLGKKYILYLNSIIFGRNVRNSVYLEKLVYSIWKAVNRSIASHKFDSIPLSVMQLFPGWAHVLAHLRHARDVRQAEGPAQEDVLPVSQERRRQPEEPVREGQDSARQEDHEAVLSQEAQVWGADCWYVLNKLLIGWIFCLLLLDFLKPSFFLLFICLSKFLFLLLINFVKGCFCANAFSHTSFSIFLS